MRKASRIDQKVRAFDNPLLEKLSRIHPAVPVCFWGPVSLVLLWLGYRRGIDLPTVAGLSLLGVVGWTLVEYALHRWIFHWQPSSARLRRLLYPVHELHHDAQEWDRVVAPLLMSIPLGGTLFALFRLVIGWPEVLPFFGGFVIGYLAYDYVHLYTHFGHPRSPIGKGLRRRHLQHHFAFPDRWFGVSSPLWDYVFRTHVPRGVKPARL